MRRDLDAILTGFATETPRAVARHVDENAIAYRCRANTEPVGVLAANHGGESNGHAAPELADLAGERGAKPLDHSVPEPPTLDDHVELLTAAGFAEVGTVWQHGTDRVLVAVR
jgi:hypothetical protein